MNRKIIVAANWKMNLRFNEVIAYISLYKSQFVKSSVQVIIAPPFPYLSLLHSEVNDMGVLIAAQNCSEFEQGAFTGEVSASMLSSLGIEICIIGHSERRKYFTESHQQLASKVDLCLKNNISPVFCFGEQLTERNADLHFAIVRKQLQESLFHLDAQNFAKTILAYEPVWAIGTGVNASSEQAQEMHEFVRDEIRKEYGFDIAENTSILYGGSCNAGNAAELFACQDVDGGLIGGASLKPDEFLTIIKSANEQKHLS